MFIKLTMFTGYYKDRPSEREVFINTDTITYFYSCEITTRRYDLITQELPTPAVESKQVTSISFVAGLNDESDSINVTESPAEIMGRVA